MALDGQRPPLPPAAVGSDGAGRSEVSPPKKMIKGCGGLECPCTARWGARGLTFHRLPRLAVSGAVKGKKKRWGKRREKENQL